MRTYLVTGGAGFIGSHVVEFYARRGNKVIAIDNLSRAKMLGKASRNSRYNWNCLGYFADVELIEGDIRDYSLLRRHMEKADVVIHTAAQTAVTTSVVNPREDFTNNVIGTLNVLEAAREGKNISAIIFCSTNKVYGENVNLIPTKELGKRYVFADDKYVEGIPETFSVDMCEHTPYGCSKLSGDLYMQDYAHLYGLKIGVFRMSCTYGSRQFGVEDQGWVAWFTIASIAGKPITIFGDGKQVRDIMYVSDLIDAYDKFIESSHQHIVVNMGGGMGNTLSLIELLDIIEQKTGKRTEVSFADWRASDQKVYISDISKAKRMLKWQPIINPEKGVEKLLDWVEQNIDLFL